MSYTLDPALVSEYEENGAVCLRKVFDRSWLDSISRGIEKNLQQPSKYSESHHVPGGPGAFFDDYCNWQRIEEFKDYAFNSPAKFIVAQLMRTKFYSLRTTKLLVTSLEFSSDETGTMTYTLNPALISEYEENGAICLRKVFDRCWLDSIRRGIEKNLQQPSSCSESLSVPGGPGAFFDDYYNWQRIEEFKDYAFNSPAKFIVAQLMRTKYVAFYHEHVLIKEPGTLKKTPWHHDQSYYPIDGYKVCSIWMPVDPVPKDTCLQFVAGSHKWNWYLPIKFATDRPYPWKDSAVPDREFKPVPDINGNRNQYKILQWDIEPGDCIVFHMRTLHGADGNLSTERSRRVFSTRWLGDDAVLARRPWNVSPPFLGGLQYGDKAVSDEFPKVWEEEMK